ncbi:MAG: hypothetical protein KA080_03725 [Leptotrichiaceae bacterium]|nr:hypothetical protein [Leptotrichiaceae bacterium]
MSEKWIGSPLVVHRRCKNPMFKVANAIAYNNNMILPESENKEAEKKSKIIYVENPKNNLNSKNRFVEEQIKVIIEDLDKEDFIITPFRTVVAGVKEYIKNEKPDLYEEVKKNIGTVHTFQGKEASTVYFLTGQGAEDFVVKKPNMLNVALQEQK